MKRYSLCLVFAVVALWSSPAWAQGALFLTGLDAEDQIVSATHPGDPNLFVSFFTTMLNCTDNGGSGILAIGASPGRARQWIEAVNAAIGGLPPVAYADGVVAINALTLADLEQYRIIHIPSDEPDLLDGSGITGDEYAALNGLAPIFDDFVNNGGGVFSLTPGRLELSAPFPAPFGFVAALGGVTVATVDTLGFIQPCGERLNEIACDFNPACEFPGLDDVNLDGCCWHNIFLTFPPFMESLAVVVEPLCINFDGQAVVIGGCQVIIPDSCDPRTQGFWKRQCEEAHPSGEHANLPDYVDDVNATATFAGVADPDEICSILLLGELTEDKCDLAGAQFMALLLNVASGRLADVCCIDSSLTAAATVGEAIDEIDALLSGAPTFQDCVLAQGIADVINRSNAIVDCGGAGPLKGDPSDDDGRGLLPYGSWGCGGTIGAHVPLQDILGSMLPLLSICLVLALLRVRSRRRATAVA